jgi:hypothetical protein
MPPNYRKQLLKILQGIHQKKFPHSFLFNVSMVNVLITCQQMIKLLSSSQKMVAASQETKLIPCCILLFGETQAIWVDIIQLN